jgi:hypothetical protein
MSTADRCVSHPTAPHPHGECAVCTRLAERAESRQDLAGGWEPEQARYERWLDTIGGSR